MIRKIVAFMVSVAFGVTMLSASADESVCVYIEMLTPEEELGYGNPVELACVVEGVEEPYIICWQYTTGDDRWYDIECGEHVYSFILDEENIEYYYRVIIYC